MATCYLCGVDGARLYASNLCLLCQVRCSATEPVQPMYPGEESRHKMYQTPVINSSQLCCLTDARDQILDQTVFLKYQLPPERARAAVDRTCGRDMDYFSLYIDPALDTPY